MTSNWRTEIDLLHEHLLETYPEDRDEIDSLMKRYIAAKTESEKLGPIIIVKDDPSGN